MLLRTCGLYALVTVVLFPTTLVAGPMAFAGIVYAWAMLSEGELKTSATMFTVLTLGAAGIISMWILFFHFLRDKENPPRLLLHCLALLAGAALSIWFVIYSGGALLSRMLFFGWPLIGAAYFLSLLFFNRVKQP